MRQQVGDELAKTTAQLDSSAADAKVSNLADMVQAFSVQVQEAFNHMASVEASFQTHVTQNFQEAVAALTWLEQHTGDRFAKVEEALTKSAALDAAVLVEAPPPPAVHPTARPARTVPSGRATPTFANLTGCAAGPFACGCGAGAVPGAGEELHSDPPTGPPGIA